MSKTAVQYVNFSLWTILMSAWSTTFCFHREIVSIVGATVHILSVVVLWLIYPVLGPILNHTFLNQSYYHQYRLGFPDSAVCGAFHMQYRSCCCYTTMVPKEYHRVAAVITVMITSSLLPRTLSPIHPFKNVIALKFRLRLFTYT